MKTMTKKTLAVKLDGKSFQTPIRKKLIESARENNLLIIYSDDLDFIRFDGVFSEYVYGRDLPLYLTRNGLVPVPGDGSIPVVEIDAYYFGNRNGQEMSPALYARLGKPVWDFDCGAISGVGAPFKIKERQEYEEGVDCFCQGAVLDLDEVFSHDRKVLCQNH